MGRIAAAVCSLASRYSGDWTTFAYAPIDALLTNIRPFTSVALNKSSAPAPQVDPPLFINVDEIDVNDGQIDKFTDAAKAHAAESVKDPGCREFNIATAQTKGNHVLLLSAFDDAAALAANQASDHYKAYQAAIKSIVNQSTALPLSSVAVLTKGQ